MIGYQNRKIEIFQDSHKDVLMGKRFALIFATFFFHTHFTLFQNSHKDVLMEKNVGYIIKVKLSKRWRVENHDGLYL